MLRNIKLTHFKCFEQLALDCTSLNLLCGLNGMGKSSVIQALLVLRQSFQTGELQDGRLVLSGDLVDLGTPQTYCLKMPTATCWDSRSRVTRWQAPGTSTFAMISGQFPTVSRLARPPWLNLKSGGRCRPSEDGLTTSTRSESGPRKSYPLSDVLARRGDFGTSGEYAWNYLNAHQDDLLSISDPRFIEDGGSRRLFQVVDRWLQDICPGAHLQLEAVNAVDAVIAGFTFDRPGDVESRRHRATNVGSACRTCCLSSSPSSRRPARCA